MRTTTLWASLGSALVLLIAPPARAQQPQGPLPPLPSSQPQGEPAPQPAAPSQPPPPGPASGPGYEQPPPPPAGPPPPYSYQPAPAPPQPFVYTEPEVPTHAPKFSLYTGPRLGAIGFGGYFYQNELGEGETTGNFIKPGVALEADVGARLGRRYIPYLFFEHTFAGAGHRFDGSSASAQANFYGLGFRYVGGDVDTVGFLTDLAIGFRSISVSNNGNTYTMTGLEIFRLGLGAEIRVTTLLTIDPLAWISGGAMNDTSGTVTYGPQGSGDGLTQPTYQNGKNIDNSRGYLAVGIGCGVHFDVFGK